MPLPVTTVKLFGQMKSLANNQRDLRVSLDGGHRVKELVAALEMVGQRFQVRAAALASYDPAFDPDGKGLEAGLEVLKAFGDIGWGP